MTLMRTEALAAADAVQRFLEQGLDAALAAGQTIRERGLHQIEVLGRGSSSHAGTVLRYALAGGSHGDLRVAAAMPSRAARAVAPGAWQGTAVLAISQSGRSPDLVRYAQVVRAAGAHVVALVNVDGSPLAEAASQVVPLCAGAERAVAATKSVIASIAAGLAVQAGIEGSEGNAHLLAALRGLPAQLRAAAACDWSPLTRTLAGARAVYVVGRGTDLGIAKELALKMAEAVGVPALAFSSAEFLHGPLGAVSEQTPVIGITSAASELESVLEALARARGRGAATLLAHGLPLNVENAATPAPDLPLPPPAGAACDAALALVPAYLAIEAAALAAGRDPDRPGGLAKVTETL